MNTQRIITKDIAVVERLVSRLAAGVNLAIEIIPGFCKCGIEAVNRAEFVRSRFRLLRSYEVVITSLLNPEPDSEIEHVENEIRGELETLEEAFCTLATFETRSPTEVAVAVTAIEKAYSKLFASFVRIELVAGVPISYLAKQARRESYYRGLLGGLRDLFEIDGRDAGA